LNNEQQTTDVVILKPQAVTNGSTTTASLLDTRESDYATLRFLLTPGAGETVATAAGATVTVLESDNTNSSTFVACASGLISPISGIKTASTQNYMGFTDGAVEVMYSIDRRGQARYLEGSISVSTAGGTNETFVVAATGTLSRASLNPNAASVEVGASNDICVIG
jgi:hypothetical protein